MAVQLFGVARCLNAIVNLCNTIQSVVAFGGVRREHNISAFDFLGRIVKCARAVSIWVPT